MGIVFGDLGVVLGLLRGLGAFFGGLGGSCSGLGASRRRGGSPLGLGGISWVGFCTHLGREKGAKTEPKTIKNRTNIHLKKRSRFRSVLRPSWGDLGSILAPSCGPKNGVVSMFREHRLFRTKVVSRHVLRRSWADLGRQKGSSWEAFWDLSWAKKGKEK